MSFNIPYGAKEKDSEGKLRSVSSINGERFVYYERLNTDPLEDDWGKRVYKKANDVWDWRVKYGGDSFKIGVYFSDLARTEFAKEKALLEKHFKTNYDPNSAKCGQDLIEAFNVILQTKEVFERNSQVLAQTNQTTLITHFPYYFGETVKELISGENSSLDLESEIIDTIKEDTSGFMFDDDDSAFTAAFDRVLNKHLDEIVEIALEKMFSAKAESGLKKMGKEEFERFSKAYQEIAQALKKMKGTASHNDFIQGLIKNYRLDDFTEQITTSGEGKNKKRITFNEKNYKEILKDKKYSFETKIKAKRGILGGGAAEYLGTFIANYMLSGLGKGFTIHTGHLGKQADMKADYEMFIGFPAEAAQEAMNKLADFEGSGRGSNVRDVERFNSEMLNEFGDDDSFIIEVNSKNYTPNLKFRQGYFNKNKEKVSLGGYSAGSAINLETWDDIMHSMNIRGRDFIFTILQLIPGAIASEKGKEEQVSDMFARAISMALFDDFEPKDPYTKRQAGKKVIHLLYLNGVYVPLSAFYTLLSQAFFGAKDSFDRKELVEVEFKKPAKILWETQEEQNADMKTKKISHPWTYQSNIALKETTVKYHFLSGFQKFIKQFLELQNN